MRATGPARRIRAMPQERNRSARRCAGTSGVRLIPSPAGSSLRLAELQDELIGVAANGGIEYLGGVRIVPVAQDVAPGFEPEARGHDFLLHVSRPPCSARAL